MSVATATSVDQIDPSHHRGLLKVVTASGNEYLVACGASKLAHVTSETHTLRWEPMTFNFTIRKNRPMVMHFVDGTYLGPTSNVKSIETVGVGSIEHKGPDMMYHVTTSAGKFDLMVVQHPQDVATIGSFEPDNDAKCHGIIEGLDASALQVLMTPEGGSMNCNFGIVEGFDDTAPRTNFNGDLQVGVPAAFVVHRTGGKYFTALVTGIEPLEAQE